MRVVPTSLDGVVVVEAPVFADPRGFFTEVFHATKFAALGLPVEWAQDNHSRSARHILRGLHFQRNQPQGKLVRPVSGTIYDVAVDLRRSSSSFGHWFGTTLDAGDGRQLYIPPGCAHGFLVLSEHADVAYKCTTLYDGASDAAVAWNDPAIAIAWPLPDGHAPVVSAKDAAAPMLAAIDPLRLMRVLVLGGSGQVGQALVRSAAQDVTIVVPTSADIDLRDPAAVRDAVTQLAPDAILNCAAFTRVDDAEVETDAAYAINAEAPRALADVAARSGARLVHVSTDYVFDGSSGAPYAADAPVAPLNVYGASKRVGEEHVLATDPRAAVVRTAWVHSGGGVNFVATAVRVLREGRVMRVVDDQVSTPTRAAHLAAALWTLVARPHVAGLLHITDAGVASWYDVAECVLDSLRQAGAAPAGAAVLPVDSSAYPRPARRPRVSLLDKHAAWHALDLTPSHWRIGVAASTLELLHA